MKANEAGPVDEEAAREEVDAFLALPPERLYLFLLLAIALLLILFVSALVLSSLDRLVFMVPTTTAAGAGVTWLLRRTPAGRGGLRTLGLGWATGGGRLSPDSQLKVWIGASVMTLGAALWVSLV